MPSETGLPPYTSEHPTTKLYRYFRRPPTGVHGSVFSRSYGTKDKKVVWSKYPAIHEEAEVHFRMVKTGRGVTDDYLKTAASAIVPGFTGMDRLVLERFNFRRMIEHRGGSWLNGMTESDKDALTTEVMRLYASDDLSLIDEVQKNINGRAVEARAIAKPAAPARSFTLMDAYKQAWLPAKHRPSNTQVEITRYVNEFTALNGTLDLKAYTRDHWAAWRADCLSKHGPGWTAFKRYTMMKTIVTEAIRAGLFERKHFTGQDIVLRKPARTKLRNEGWMEDELKELWSAPFFRIKDKTHPDANYWVPLICATTGARLSEVTGMFRTDAAKRHGLDTLYLAKEAGKTEDSRRIIPVPQVLIDLGWLRYIASRPKDGKLFDAGAKVMSQWFSRVRADLGLTRKGCDIHAMRHHIRTLLSDLECPDRVADYITGHAPPNVGGTYGKTELSTALRYLNRVDLGIKVPKWKSS